jgi:hypothetical protein
MWSSPSFGFEDGRESPYRYVHGALLHNVVEEEEQIMGAVRCVTDASGALYLISEIEDCRNCPLHPTFFLRLLYQNISYFPLLANIRCLLDELDGVCEHGKPIIDTPSHIPHH